MNKVTSILANLFLIFTPCFGQGLNNNYPIDNEDLTNIFKIQGINVFKFPFELKKGEYISLSYCVYENGIEKERRNWIEDFQINLFEGLDFQIDHHLARRDTTVFHRIYFMNQEDSLNIRIVVPGLSMENKIDISKIAVGDYTASINIKENLPEKQDILSFYALYRDSEKYKKSDGILNCATGLSPEKLITNYDFVLIFFAERITKERAKSILEEDYYRQIHNKP
jgi:hypothetical protein